MEQTFFNDEWNSKDKQPEPTAESIYRLFQYARLQQGLITISEYIDSISEFNKTQDESK